jgi:hypothetical protein
MRARAAGAASVALAIPWCCVLPAVLSTLALGSAAAARQVVVPLMPALFLLSVAFLTYAHYLVWIRRTGHRASRWILGVNTVLVAGLWVPSPARLMDAVFKFSQ